MICGSRGSKSKLAKAAGAEPCGWVRDEKWRTAVVRRPRPSQNVQCTSAPERFLELRRGKGASRCGAKQTSKRNLLDTPPSELFWKMRCSQSARRCGMKQISKSKRKTTTCSDHFWTFACRFSVVGPRDCAPCHLSKVR